MLQELIDRYEARRSELTAEIGKAQAAEEAVQRLFERIRDKEQLVETLAQVSELFQRYSDAEHEALREQVESLVTYGIRTVFGEELTFRIVPGVKGNQATMDFVIEDPEIGETDILSSRGGGLAAVVGFVLRVVMLRLSPGRDRESLILDESFGMVSEEYQPSLAELLRVLAEKMGVQIILVTHQPRVGYGADVIYRFDHDGTKTVVTPLERESL